MIRTRKELEFYLAADLMMNRGKFRLSLVDKIKDLIFPDYLVRYLRHMRFLDFYSGKANYPPRQQVTPNIS